MGEAKRKRQIILTGRWIRFAYLLRKISSRYSDKEIMDFIKRRKDICPATKSEQ